MVANFAAGGAAINQLARIANAQLRVIPLSLDRPTADFTQQPALSEEEFLAAVAAGYHAVSPASDLLCLGEMGIGNTTAAAAIAAALFGGGSARWAGRGTGVDEEGLARKRDVIDQALALNLSLGSTFSGVYADFEHAKAAIPANRKVGYNHAAAARPPRASARSAERSSSSATSSSGPSAACARCHARRSGSTGGSVASANARCGACRSSSVAAA